MAKRILRNPIYLLFLECFSASGIIASDGRVTWNDMEESGHGQLELLSLDLPGGTEEYREKPQCG